MGVMLLSAERGGYIMDVGVARTKLPGPFLS
jgi:hypothetical protein